MAESLLAAAPFRKYQLAYEAPAADPNNPARGTVTAFVSVDQQRQLHHQPGADAEVTPVKAELVKPLTLPAGVGVGSTITLTWGGRPASILVTSVIPNDLVGVPLGDLILGELRYE